MSKINSNLKNKRRLAAIQGISLNQFIQKAVQEEVEKELLV
jgi:predicted HicB family RNase H-like nuclease